MHRPPCCRSLPASALSCCCSPAALPALSTPCCCCSGCAGWLAGQAVWLAGRGGGSVCAVLCDGASSHAFPVISGRGCRADLRILESPESMQAGPMMVPTMNGRGCRDDGGALGGWVRARRRARRSHATARRRGCTCARCALAGSLPCDQRTRGCTGVVLSWLFSWCAHTSSEAARLSR